MATLSSPERSSSPAAQNNGLLYTRFNLRCALLFGLMITNLAAVLAGLAQRLLPGWQPVYLLGACFVIALESAFVQYTVRQRRMWFMEASSYVMAEIAVLLAAMRVITTLGMGGSTLEADVQLWLRSPLAAVFDTAYICHVAVGIIIGVSARNVASNIQTLEPKPFEGPTGDDLESQVFRSRSEGERSEALRQINNRFIGGGVLLLLAMALQVVNIRTLVGDALQVQPSVALAAFTYLVCGFLIYSQARLAWNQARWHMDGAEIEASVLRRWHGVSLLLVLGVAGLALLLPRRYGLGLLDSFRWLVEQLAWLINMLMFQLAMLISTLLGLLIAIPAALFGWFSGTPPAPLPPPEPLVLPPPPPAPPAPPANTDVPVLPSLIFWLCMALLVGYALWITLQRHPGVRHAWQVLRSGPLHGLFARLAALWHGVQHYSHLVAERIGSQFQPTPPTNTSRQPQLRLSRLAPRELVRYFYRSTLERATRAGFSRRPSQTPGEYGARLAEQLPEARDDIATLTEAYQRATYSPRPPGAAETKTMKKPWQRLRAVLRRRREREENDRIVR
ncbi:MAG: DUF4129 domain-containing protein [Chloroflexaceae bacterium]|jgi:hypothetical protein|nr:DUF4129 domain-containing protein [Chloroflexaceae bacterium]